MELIILSFTWDSKPTEWWPWIIKLFACWLATCLECEAQNSYWKQLTKDCQSKFYVLLMNLLPSGSFFREINTASVLTQSGLKTESTHGTHWMTTFTEALKTLEDKKVWKPRKTISGTSYEYRVKPLFPWFFISSGCCLTFVYWRILLVIMSWSENWVS